MRERGWEGKEEGGSVTPKRIAKSIFTCFWRNWRRAWNTRMLCSRFIFNKSGRPKIDAAVCAWNRRNSNAYTFDKEFLRMEMRANGFVTYNKFSSILCIINYYSD